MKKFLISVLIFLFTVLAFFAIFRNISIGQWTSKNINDVKSSNDKLNEKINYAKQLNNQEYPEQISKLDTATEKLKVTKEKYKSKLDYISEDINLDVVKVKHYKVEKLWIAIENYAKQEEVELKLDILDTSTTGVYDLNVTVVGEYIGITDFIYDIEKDDTLGFKILNFKMIPGVQVTQESTQEDTKTDSNDNNKTNTTVTTVNVDKLTATFKIEDVAIEFN